MASSLPFLILSLCAVAESVRRSKYCIVGAGPAGLQLGQNFLNAGVDYVTFERGEHAGMFFKHYPIHRQLISVNKRASRSSSDDFNLRHDWNSLLHNKAPRFTKVTTDYFPNADVLVEYLRNVSVEQQGNIFYHHQVTNISKSDAGGFDVTIADFTNSNEKPTSPVELRTGNSIPRLEKVHEVRWHCGKVIGAIGLWKPHTPDTWLRGLDRAVGYDELIPWKDNKKAFQNLSVLIVGNGNAAFETTDALRNYASEIALFGRRAERLARETHYVGDGRGHRMSSIDSMELQGLDVVSHSPQDMGNKLEMIPCESPGPDRGQLGQGWPQGSPSDSELKGFRGQKPVCIISDYSSEEFLIADFDTNNKDIKEFARKFGDNLTVHKAGSEHKKWHKWGVKKYGTVLLEAAGITDVYNTTVLTMKKEVVRELATTSAAFRKALPGLLATTQGLYPAHSQFRKPVDVVIKAFGWRLESEPFQNLGVLLDQDAKYPVTDACYHAKDKDGRTLEGMYWAGTITHGFDKKRFGSAGGFIHGFRYTAESLFRCLMHEEGKPLWEGSKHVFSWDLESSCSKTDGMEVCQTDSPSMVASDKVGTNQQMHDGGMRRKSPTAIRRELEQTPRWSHLMKRANEASGPYQMSCGALLDGIVYDKAARTATYYENMPLDVFEANFINTTRLVLQLRYGQGADYVTNELAPPSGLRSGVYGWASKFLHPVFMFAQPSVRLEDSTRLHIVECRFTDFAGRDEVLAVHNFVKKVEAAAWTGTKPPVFHEKLDQLRLDCSHHWDHTKPDHDKGK